MFAPFKIRDSAAAECLNKDRDVPLTFYDFRAELWKHLRNHEPHRKQFTTCAPSLNSESALERVEKTTNGG
jgi:hypothetical protein